jgi:crossover junction endodeoxyribonuclease RuvC
MEDWMIFAAIDPGAVSAAIAVFENATPIHVNDLRITGSLPDSVSLAQALTDLEVKHVVIENVHAMPKQGLASTFRFGMGTGIIHGVCGALRLPMTLVTPCHWKAFHGLNSEKEKARVLALRKWPEFNAMLERKKDINRAEALLIGDWFYVRCIVPRTPETPSNG